MQSHFHIHLMVFAEGLVGRNTDKVLAPLLLNTLIFLSMLWYAEESYKELVCHFH